MKRGGVPHKQVNLTSRNENTKFPGETHASFYQKRVIKFPLMEVEEAFDNGY
ncbi:hypothetical protein J2Y02_000098 [Neobacillus drentensis]|nr:hypothetical protein [Neobacillus drentensis]